MGYNSLGRCFRQHEKYLGFPSLVGRNKRNIFNAMKEKFVGGDKHLEELS